MIIMNEAEVSSLMREHQHGYRLSEWLHMKEGTRVPGNAMFRQKKEIYARVCNHLGLPVDGTKPALMTRVKSYAFTSEQIEEMKQSAQAERAAREAARTRERVNRRLDALEAGHRPYDYYTYAVLSFHGRAV